MPTVLRTGPYRIYFYSHEPNEPPHVHIDREKLSAKFWLNPTRIARNFGFSSRELRQIERLIRVIIYLTHLDLETQSLILLNTSLSTGKLSGSILFALNRTSICDI